VRIVDDAVEPLALSGAIDPVLDHPRPTAS